MTDVWQSLSRFLTVHFSSLMQKVNHQLFICNFISLEKSMKLTFVVSRVPQNVNHCQKVIFS